MIVQEAVAERIRDLCDERNITPNRLSYIAGVPQSTIKSILNGESTNPGISTIKKLCDGFGVSLEAFFAGDEFSDLEQELI